MDGVSSLKEETPKDQVGPGQPVAQQPAPIAAAPVVDRRPKSVVSLNNVTIRFAGDSGDGMQVAGTHFPVVSALVGNDISPLRVFPAETRAPAGTLAGVSGYQIHFADSDIFTPGDDVDTLIAMNPAA